MPNIAKRKRGRPPTGRTTVNITVTLPPILRDWVKNFSAREQVTMSAIIARALLSYRKELLKGD